MWVLRVRRAETLLSGHTLRLRRERARRARAGSGRLRRTAGGEVSLTLRDFQLRLFPGTANERVMTGGSISSPIVPSHDVEWARRGLAAG